MTFLILKMSVYLLVALGLGGAAGWLSRNLSAQREVDTLGKALNETRAKIPQLESLMRGRDQELKKIKGQQEQAEEQLRVVTEHAESYESMITAKDIEIRSLKAQAEQVQTNPSEADDESSELSDVDDLLHAADSLNSEPLDYAAVEEEVSPNQKTVQGLLGSIVPVDEETAAKLLEQAKMIQLLRDQIERLEVELSDAQYQLEAAQKGDGLSEEVNELTGRLRQKAQEYDRLNREFEAEKRKVGELERERDLQNKSLQVLHQQLELERSDSSTSQPTEVE